MASSFGPGDVGARTQMTFYGVPTGNFYLDYNWLIN